MIRSLEGFFVPVDYERKYKTGRFVFVSTTYKDANLKISFLRRFIYSSMKYCILELVWLVIELSASNLQKSTFWSCGPVFSHLTDNVTSIMGLLFFLWILWIWHWFLTLFSSFILVISTVCDMLMSDYFSPLLVDKFMMLIFNNRKHFLCNRETILINLLWKKKHFMHSLYRASSLHLKYLKQYKIVLKWCYMYLYITNV